MENVVSLNKVSKQFDQAVVVDQLSFEVRAGEIFGFLGPNGAGKTTIVNIITGLLDSDSGTVSLFAEHHPGSAFARANIGLASQSLALYEDLTATENLHFFGKMQNLNGAELDKATSRVLDIVGLTDKAGQRVGTYSGGMQRRLNLAVAILHNPQLLILDEPTVGVDPQSRNAIMKTIQQLRDQGHTIIYTTHYMEEVEKLCDRVAIIDHGKLVALDSVPQLLHKYGSEYQISYRKNQQEYKLSSKDPLASIRELLDSDQQEDITNLVLQSPTLEQVFLNLTGHQLRD